MNISNDQQELYILTCMSAAALLVLLHHNTRDNDDDQKRNTFLYFNAAPPKSWEYPHRKTLYPQNPHHRWNTSFILRARRRRDLGVLLWRRRYWPWWWTGHLCNLNVIPWKASPTQPVAFIWMCLQKIQLLFLSFYFFHPLISTLLPMH